MTARKVTQFKPRDPFQQVSVTEARMTARDMLQAQAAQDGEAVEGELSEGAPRPVRINADASGWVELPPNADEFDGWVIEWSAESVPVPATDTATVGRPDGDGRYVVDVPAHVAAIGGEVRIEHGLSAPVTVEAYAAGEPVGYLMAVTLTPDVEQVTLAAGAGTTRLVVVKDDPVT